MPNVRPCGGRLPAGRPPAPRAAPAAALAVAAWSALAGSVLAEPAHHGPGTPCADCHLVAAGDASGASAPGGARTLLRAADPVDLCLSCHDGQCGVPDVLGEDVNRLADRAAGFFLVVDGPPGRGHALGRGGGRRAGQGALTCVDCHDPHGNGLARELRAGGGANALGLLVDPAAVGLERYESSRIRYGTLDDDRLREISVLCLECHPAKAGARAIAADGRAAWSHHPAYDSRRGDVNSIAQGAATGGTDPAHWEGGSGAGFAGLRRVPVLARGAADYACARDVAAARNGVFCLSCHRAHGSGHAFGLRWTMRAPGAASGCEQCHHAGRDGPRPSPAPGAPPARAANDGPAGTVAAGSQPSFAPPAFFTSSR